MARKRSAGGVNKSEEIRTFLRENQGAATGDVVTALAARGIEVSAGLVSNIKYTSSKKKPGRRKKGGPGRPPAQESVSISALLGAKKLVNEVGSVDAARKALDSLEKAQLR
jgi:hypothetical protein